ncbi:hypothetical protein [Candidatus Palauibacter sp.]|uniref:hypothetical protein n=1 Tax=Candidatus Palauibacter sp. TaxID=3101350 RepID=UPI003AF2069E
MRGKKLIAETGQKDGHAILTSPTLNEVDFTEHVIASCRSLLDLDLSSAPLRHQVFKENLQYALGRYVIVDGEWCVWREDDVLGIVVKREPWSLLGTGETLDAAVADFRREAAALATVMRHDDLEDLTEEARRMQDFVLRYLRKDE